MFVCEWVGLLPRELELACIDLHQTRSVGKGSDHLQLIKLWPSHTPGKGVCGGTIFFWLRLTTAIAQCLRLSERFFIAVAPNQMISRFPFVPTLRSCTSCGEWPFAMYVTTDAHRAIQPAAACRADKQSYRDRATLCVHGIRR